MSLREQLQAIYDERGKLTPALVVEEARPDSHPLHDRFEWDDAIAGEAYRRAQAHDLIQSVRISHARENKEPLSVRAWHAVRGEEGHVFKPTDEILEDPLLTKILLSDMQREWRALHARYERFQEFRTLVLADLEAAS